MESFWDAFRLTENGHVKSTLLLNSFCLSILFLAVYGAAFFLLTDPIHAWLALAPRAVENLVSALLPALIGTAICALTHLICHPQTVLAAYGWLLLLALASLVTMLLLLRGDHGASVLFLQLFGMMVPVPLLMGFEAPGGCFAAETPSEYRFSHVCNFKKGCETMIDTVLFDMGGTLEDIWVDDESRHSSIQGVLDILRAHGIDLNMDFETAAQSINAGWERYGAYRDPRQRELKPEEIWGSFVLTDFGLNEDSVRPYAEELAHMWEITHYHRTLRPPREGNAGRAEGAGYEAGRHQQHSQSLSGV